MAKNQHSRRWVNLKHNLCRDRLCSHGWSTSGGDYRLLLQVARKLASIFPMNLKISRSRILKKPLLKMVRISSNIQVSYSNKCPPFFGANQFAHRVNVWHIYIYFPVKNNYYVIYGHSSFWIWHMYAVICHKNWPKNI